MKNVLRNDCGVWFKILFWAMLVCNPITALSYIVLWIGGMVSAEETVYIVTSSIFAVMAIWRLRTGFKSGWYLMLGLVLLGMVHTAVILPPEQLWVLLATPASIFLWYLTLRHKGFWYRLR
jgi:hypothetical protein